MFVAAWTFDMNFGSRTEVLGILKRTLRQMTPEQGFRAKRSRILVGSIGAPESRILMEHEFASLDDLEASWAGLHERADFFREWVASIKPHVVAGTPRWEVYRVVE